MYPFVLNHATHRSKEFYTTTNIDGDLGDCEFEILCSDGGDLFNTNDVDKVYTL